MNQTTLTELRASLTDFQRSMLDATWNHLIAHGAPLPLRAFYHAFPRESADAALRALGGKVIIQHYAGISSFSPTLIGALLGTKGKYLEDLLCRCLKFVRDQYDREPGLQTLSGEQFQRDGRFSQEEVEELRTLLSLAYHSLVIQSGGGQRGGPWTLLVRDEVDQLRRVSDWRAYIDAEVMRGFDPSFPVEEARRMTAMMSENARLATLAVPSVTNGTLNQDERPGVPVAEAHEAAADRWLKKLKDIRVLAALIVMGTVIAGVAAVLKSGADILDIIHRFSAHTTQGAATQSKPAR